MKTPRTHAAADARLERGPLRAAGLALGMGMGGFVDGIVFHQILQFHSMLSARIPNDVIVGAKINMFWDGVFHAAVWILTAIGVALLWRAGRRPRSSWSGRLLLGSMVFGWGLFNAVEGVIDHHVLGLHHVYEPAGLSGWDVLFVAWGLAMIAVGWALMRARDASVEAETGPGRYGTS